MKKLVLFSAVCIILFSSFVQKGEVIIMSGEDIPMKLVDTLLYVFPQFEKGLVIFKDGTRSEAFLNICTLNQNLLFIDEASKGDTLAVVNVNDVSSVHFDKRTFVRWNSAYFLEVFNPTKEVSVALGRTLKLKQPKKEGLYGTNANNTAGVYSVTRFYDDFGKKWSLKQDIHFPWDYTHYILLQKGDHFYPAIRKNIFKVFPDKTQLIEAYLKDNNINFSKVEDVQKLVDACLAM